MPSQASAIGWTFETQSIAPFEQASVPAPQAPGIPVVQDPPVPGASSTTPLQLLSRPSQTSAEDMTFCTHVRIPLMHEYLPAAQTPWLGVVQGLSFSVYDSSMS